MATAVGVTRTNNAEIDGLLGGSRWSGTITYSFTDSPSDYSGSYGGNGEPTTFGFSAAPVAMQQAINYAISLISGYTNASFQYAGTNGGDISIAQSPAANPTSYAYYPANVPAGGDIWFGTAYNYSLAASGNYYFATALHELGHALGLKHSQEIGGVANVAVPAAHDNSEYTIMSYRSYAGAPLTGYTAESYGYSQTYMANDILALQTLYGANYATHSENTVYSWSATTAQMFINGVAQLAPGNGVGGSANRVFETIWDGNGVDTYDLSNYTTAVTINLNPGAYSITSSTQLAYLGSGHYAAGNIYNAYLFNGDTRSYIDNAIGGASNDVLIGNAIANTLSGGSGIDTITGGGGNDTIIGGSGLDTAVYSGNKANYTITFNTASQTFTISDQRSGSPDGADSLSGVEYFQFADGTVAIGAPVLNASNLTETAGWSPVVLSSCLTYSNPIDLPPVTWRIQDVSTDGANALLLNGSPLSASLPINLTSAQFAQVTVGAVTSSHEIWAVVSDGASWSSPVHFIVSPPAPVAALGPPVLTPSSVQQTIAWSPAQISTYLTYSDPANLAAVTWRIQDVSSDGTSALLLNGSPLSASVPVNLTAAQFAQAMIGSVTSSHEIWAVASDGTYWSSPVHFSVSPPASVTTLGPPVLTALDLHEVAGSPPVNLSAHLNYSDPANIPAVIWRIQDVSSDGANALSLNGSPLSASLPVNLTPSQFAQVAIASVSSTHEIWAVANDGTYWSAPVHFTVSPPAAAPLADNFAFAADLSSGSDLSTLVSRHIDYVGSTNTQREPGINILTDASHTSSHFEILEELLHHSRDFHIL